MDQDFSENKKLCLTKALLVCLSDNKTFQDGFKLYETYIKSFVLTEADTNIISHQRRPELQEQAVSAFFKTNKKEDPAFFNFSNFTVN